MKTRREEVNGQLTLSAPDGLRSEGKWGFALSLALVVGFVLGAGAAPKYQATITASGYAGSTTLTNFPVLVSVSSEKIDGFKYSQCAAGGADLSFVLADGTVLSHEIDTWNTEGESTVWVKIPSLAKDTAFMMRWGDKDPASVTASDVWADYVGVWHLGDAADTAACANSSPYGATYDAVPDGTGKENQKIYAGDDAPVGRARCFSETQTNSCLIVSNYNATGVTSVFTVSTWARVTEIAGNTQLFWRKTDWNGNSGWYVEHKAGTRLILLFGSSGTSVSNSNCPTLLNAWVHVTGVYDGGTATLYCNGTKYASGSITTVASNELNLRIGGGTWAVSFDECRFMKGAASADWVQAEYDTMAKRSGAAAFLSYSGVQNLTEELFVGTPRLVSLGDRSAVVSLAVVKLGAGATKATVTAAYGTSPNALSRKVFQTVDAASTCELTLTGLQTGRRYYVAITAANDQGESVACPTFELALPSVQYQATITASGYAGTSVLKNFPVLVRISEAKIDGFKYSQCAADGSDLSFVSADGLTTYSHEIDTWDPEGESLVWVKLPTLEKDSKFLMCWGDRNPPSVTASDVWADYVGVWHLGDAADAAACANSSPYGATYDAVPDGTGKANHKVYAGDDAPVGRAHCFSETSVDSYLMVSNYNATGVTSAFTASAWVRASEVTGTSQLFWRKTGWDGNSGWYVERKGAEGKSLFLFGSSGTGVSSSDCPTLLNAWVHVTGVYDGGTATLYCNGTKYASGSIATVASNDLNLRIGGGAWAVSYDECRLMKGAASAERVKADYDTVKSATFLTYGAAVQNKLPGFMLFIR